MPNKCVVPFCRSNYKSSDKISVFKFPKSEELMKKWLLAIKRKNLVVSKNSKVCEKHFKESDIRREASGITESGEILIVPLQNKYLYPHAVPSIFPGYPKIFTKETLVGVENGGNGPQMESKHSQASVRVSVESEASQLHSLELPTNEQFVTSRQDERPDKVAPPIIEVIHYPRPKPKEIVPPRQKRQRLTCEIQDVQNKTKDVNVSSNSVPDKKEEDECELYAKLLAKKLRNYSEHERHQIMYEIDGLLLKNPPRSRTMSPYSSYSQSPVYVHAADRPSSTESSYAASQPPMCMEILPCKLEINDE